MAAMDVKARDLAFRLLNRFGKSCVLKSVVTGTYDKETATISRTPMSHTVKAYLETPNRQDLLGGQVVVTDEMAIFAAQGLVVEPAINDRFTVDAKDRTIKSVTRIWSGDQVALWRVGLRA